MNGHWASKSKAPSIQTSNHQITTLSCRDFISLYSLTKELTTSKIQEQISQWDSLMSDADEQAKQQQQEVRRYRYELGLGLQSLSPK
jgi:hypothetical protein